MSDLAFPLSYCGLNQSDDKTVEYFLHPLFLAMMSLYAKAKATETICSAFNVFRSGAGFRIENMSG